MCLSSELRAPSSELRGQRSEDIARREGGFCHHEVAAVFARQLEEGVDLLDGHGGGTIAEHVPAREVRVRHSRGGGWASLLSEHLPALVSHEVWVR